MPSLGASLSDIYTRLLVRFSPAGTDPASELADDVARLLNLTLLAVPVLIAFIAEFAVFKIWQLSLSLAAAGVVMVAAPWIYKRTGSLAIARESFLVSLFLFKLYESLFLASITSPGTIWLIGLPVIAILLGSVASGACWLAVSIASLSFLFRFYGQAAKLGAGTVANLDFLYTFSMVFFGVSVATFVLMVHLSRKKAYQRLQEANEVIHQLAIRDPLTGIYNRRHIWERMHSEERRGAVDGGRFHVCLIDLDRFKHINDTAGHAAGDLVLKTVAREIQGEIREQDCFARYGGEEFILLVKGADDASADALAERIRLKIAGLRFAELPALGPVTVSIGIAQLDHGKGFAEAIHRADVALYAAKHGGRNRVVLDRVPLAA